MNATARLKTVLALALAVILVPVLAHAQLGGAVQGAKQGIKKGAEKTKEGAEAVGQKGKEVITGEENDPSKNRMKPSETPSTTTRSTTSETKTETETETPETGQKRMPKTAGELPLLALAGWSALSAAGVSRLVRRK